MVEEWKSKPAAAAKEAWEIEADAVAAIEAAKATATPELLDEANKMMEIGRENLNIVVYGGSVHNQKYSVTLIDAAMISFEDAIDLLEEEEEYEDEEYGDCECADGKLDCVDEEAEAEAKEYGCECDDEDYLVCDDEAYYDDEDEDEEEEEE